MKFAKTFYRLFNNFFKRFLFLIIINSLILNKKFKKSINIKMNEKKIIINIKTIIINIDKFNFINLSFSIIIFANFFIIIDVIINIFDLRKY